MTKYDLIVKTLEQYEEARNDKHFCYCMFGVLANKITVEESQLLFSLMGKVWDFEGVRRGRQTIQNKDRPDLWPNKDIAKIRNELADRARITKWKSVYDERMFPPTK